MLAPALPPSPPAAAPAEPQTAGAAHEPEAGNRLLAPALSSSLRSTSVEDGPSARNVATEDSSTSRGTATEDGSFEEERETPIVASPASVESTDSPTERNGEAVVQASGPAKNPTERSPERAKATQNLPQPQKNPLEYCLVCGTELPALLPNGMQVSHYCQCGQSLSLPGLNLRAHCSQCGVALPVHGYNAQRVSDICSACGANLPPLDPKASPPWIPPYLKSTVRKA